MTRARGATRTHAGHRLQVVINFAAPGVTKAVSPAPKVTVYRDREHPSAIVFPIIED